MNALVSEYFFYYFTLFSILRFILVIILSNQTPVEYGEKRVRLLVNVGFITDVIHLFLLVIFHGFLQNIIVKEFLYLSIDFKLSWDTYSIAYLCFSVFLINLVARFSIYYLHRDNYFYKFFSLLYIFELSVVVLIVTISSESLFLGWELLGISSVLLIAFYEHKTSVLKNSLTILVIYKISDILFYSMLIITTSHGGTSYLDSPTTLTLSLALISCLIKSSVFPWIWLPRAMEGPTPSSAIFYGGIATHVPIFIFLNIWSQTPTHNVYFVITFSMLIFTSTFITSMLSKQAPDAKNAIAYSSITQLGIIYIEILFGFYTLAVIHSIANGTFRSIEFLKSPSLLYNYHSIEQSRKKLTYSSGFHLERILPNRFKNYLYYCSYHEFFVPRCLISNIQSYLGLHSSRASKRPILIYCIISFTAFLLFELIVYSIFESKITVLDEFLLMAAFAFNIFAMMYKYHPVRFFVCLCASVSAVFTMLIEHINSEHTVVDFIFIIMIIFFGINIIKNNKTTPNHINYHARAFRSDFSNLIILFAGISLVGIPGLFSFIIWEHLEDHVIHSSPDLILDGFFIMALNTIVFFRFYYANYLGESKENNSLSTIIRQ